MAGRLEGALARQRSTVKYGVGGGAYADGMQQTWTTPPLLGMRFYLTMASKKFLIFAISFIVSFFYFALRVLAGGGLEEATVSAVMLGGFLVIVTFANKLEKLSELSRIFDRSLRPWLSLLISLAVGVMAISNGKTIPLIMLDVFFAFFFFTCFFSIVFRLKK